MGLGAVATRYEVRGIAVVLCLSKGSSLRDVVSADTADSTHASQALLQVLDQIIHILDAG